MTDWVLSVDVGGTKTLVGAIGRDGAVLGEWMQPTRGAGDDEIAAAIGFAAASASDLSGAPLAVAVGVPEYVTADGRVVSDEVLRWHVDPSEALQAAFGMPAERCVIGSDVRFGAQGEAVYGAGRDVPSFLYVSLGTGLSSAFVVDGRVWPGARGEAIALGECRPAAAEGLNIEQYASGAGIEARYAAVTGETRTGRELVAAAASGDDRARAVLVSAGEALGDILADVVGVLDPHGVVLGGGLGSADTLVRHSLITRYRARTGRRPGAAEVAIATCGHRSGAMGGAAAAWAAAEAAGELAGTRTRSTQR
ncbi:ROK family protein [Microbacterium sp. ASV49]|uniref:ROK family protein n=1 Tax=Microbacterium candidum TaxID=3041922 RepID=A0ABT7MU00_9MICO|nr:ROK family protein [Microbacterium sp. ASV49]MDL9977930.1 ROK family protein [Microbacterium sp. ASV49]